MSLLLSYKPPSKRSFSINISGSKSESNRLLILKALYPNLEIANISDSDDTILLTKGLLTLNGTVDVHHAGTAMRFLTAYFAAKEGVNIVLTGSKRMQERPLHILVDALKSLGAEIEYLKEEGYPPLKIVGKKIIKNKIAVNANVSSQYITALMLIAPSLVNGLEITLKGTVTSSPYITMTLHLLQKVGVSCSFEENKIKIIPLKNTSKKTISVESDWSSASYFYSIVALSENLKIELSNFSKNSLQGDASIAKILEQLGVKTKFNKANNTILLQKNKKRQTKVQLNLIKTPDIAQTIAVTCFGLGIDCHLKGLKTLKIKETDRLLALKTELEKLGAKVSIDNDSIKVISTKNSYSNSEIDTYNDHRMAMAFAPLALKNPIVIKNPEVVSKSYPSFWNDLKKVGFFLKEK